MSDLCPICKTELKKVPDSPLVLDLKTFSCPRCGDFIISTGILLSTLPTALQKNNADVKISHAIRMMQCLNEKVVLTEDMIQSILKKQLPRPQEQSKLICLYVGLLNIRNIQEMKYILIP